MHKPLLNIVLHEPEIPNNTGNIGRTCIATGCHLHLIHPLAFDTSEKKLRRAGLDYWHRLKPHHHDSWNHYLKDTNINPQRIFMLTTRATTPIWEATFQPADHIVFGKETAGLPKSLLQQHAQNHPQNLLTLPMVQGERSLNLATAVTPVIYEALRQFHQSTHITLDRHAAITRRNESSIESL